MANYGERDLANHRRQHGQNGSEGGRGGGGDRGLAVDDRDERIAESLEHIADVALHQHNKARSFTAVYTATIGQVPAGTPIFRDGLHLPEDSAIGGAAIENYSTTATLTVYEGTSGNGRVIAIIPGSRLRRIALADHVSSISIVSSAADATALVIVTLTSSRAWSPTQGSLV